MIAPLILASLTSPDLDSLQRDLDALCAGFHGQIGYCVRVLKSGKTISHNGTRRFPTASTIKTAILVEAINQVEEGKIKWTDTRKVPPTSERTENMASMWAYYLKDGTTLNLDGWCNLMITYSDNTATKVVGMWMGNQPIRDRMASFGLEWTSFLSYSSPDATWFRRWNRSFGMGVTTPLEMNQLWTRIAERKATKTAAGAERLLRILGRQYWDDAAGATTPPEVKVFNKTGAISRSRSETAFIEGENPYILTIYTDDQADQRWTADNEGDLILQKISSLVWNRLNPHHPYKAPEGAEKFAPTGGGLE